MKITKEQIKRLANAIKAMQEETLIDDDVNGGYKPNPFKDAYTEIYTVIDECERGLNTGDVDRLLTMSNVSNRRLLYFDFMKEYNALMGESEHQILKEEVEVLLAKYSC